MKKLCLIMLIQILTFQLFAQSQKGYVYLKNGSVIKGKFQYTEDLTKLKIESAGNIWIFGADEIERTSNRNEHLESAFQSTEINSTLFLRTEIGVLAGSSENSQTAPFSFTSSINYTIIPKLSAGAGIGIEFLKESYLPAFINMEYKLRDSYSTPYLFFKAGYEVPLEKSKEIYGGVQPVFYDYYWPGSWNYYNEQLDTKGGFLINPGIGYHRMFSSGFGMSFAFGYQFHRLSYSGENNYHLDIDYNRLTIKLGIIFN